MKRTVLFSLAFCLAFFCLLTGCKDKELNGPAIPFVKTNDFVFVYDGESKAKSELPDNYTVIGEVEKTSSIPDEAKNGESSCCKPGEKIYQSPENTDEVYVYTTLFSGDGQYRYLRFVKD